MIFYFFFDSVLLSFFVLDIIHTEVRFYIHLIERDSFMIELMSDGDFVFQILSLVDRIKNPLLNRQHENLISGIYQNSEFISSDPKCSILQPYRFFDYRSEINQYLISFQMSESIVDFLKIIDINDDERIFFVPE